MAKTAAQEASPVCRRLIRFLKNNGYVEINGRNEHQLMSDILAVDVENVRFRNPKTGDSGTVLLIVSNGWEVLADWSYKEGSKFDRLMEQFSDTIEEPS